MYYVFPGVFYLIFIFLLGLILWISYLRRGSLLLLWENVQLVQI